MDSLREAVRKACPPGLWSQAVHLVRDGAVVVEGDVRKKGAGEVIARIRAPGVPVAPTVVLYVKDGEWACDCGGKFDPCQHVAAAVIFITQGPGVEAPPLSGGSAGGVVGAVGAVGALTGKVKLGILEYQFSRLDGILYLERVVVFPDGGSLPFVGSATNRVTKGDLPFLPTHEDLVIDRMMSSWKVLCRLRV
jgi:SWIM zinc finger